MNEFVRSFCLALCLLTAPTTWATQFAYISNSSGNSVSVIDIATNTATATVPVGSGPFGVAVSPTGPEAADVYVTNNGSNTVSVIDPTTNTVIATVPVGSGPFGVAVAPAGPNAGDVYVTNNVGNTVSVINPATNTVTATVPVGSGPFGVAVAAAGDVYVTNNVSNTVSVINPATNTVITTVPVGSGPFGVAVEAAGDVYVTNNAGNTVSVINPVTNTLITTVPVGSGPFGVAVAAAGPNAGDVYVTNNASNTVSLINPVTNTVIATVPVGSGPRGVAITPDGLDVYVANELGNTVSVIATATNTVISTIPAGNRPIAFGQFIGGVNKADTTTAVTSSVNPSLFGQSTTFTATVSPIPSGAGTPTGMVTFLDGASPIGAATLSGGEATSTTSALAVGNHTITAVYGGDTNYVTSTSDTVTQQVNKIATTTSLATDCMTKFVENQPFTATATVSGAAPTGSVSFATHVLICSSVPLSSGSASCTTNVFSAGGSATEQGYSLIASYPGDDDNTPSTSAAIIVVALKASDVVFRNDFEMGSPSCPVE